MNQISVRFMILTFLFISYTYWSNSITKYYNILFYPRYIIKRHEIRSVSKIKNQIIVRVTVFVLVSNFTSKIYRYPYK